MRLKDRLSLIVLFFGFVTPIIYSTGLFFNAGWEAYWGIPQGIFKLDFDTVVVSGYFYITDLLVRFFLYAIGILLFCLIIFLPIKILRIIYRFLIQQGKVPQFRGWAKQKYFCKWVIGNQEDQTYNPYEKKSVIYSKWFKKMVILLFALIVGTIMIFGIIMDSTNAGCRMAESRAVGIQNDIDWVNNFSIEFENHKNSKFIPLKCGQTYCAVADTKTLQVHILKVNNMKKVTTPRSILELRNPLLSNAPESLCKFSLLNMVKRWTWSKASSKL